MRFETLPESESTLANAQISKVAFDNITQVVSSLPDPIVHGRWLRFKRWALVKSVAGPNINSRNRVVREPTGLTIMRLLLTSENEATPRREGSGSIHKQEFIQFLNIARRSLFEDASMLLVFERLGLLKETETDELLWDCDKLSRGITNFSRAL